MATIHVKDSDSIFANSFEDIKMAGVPFLRTERKKLGGEIEINHIPMERVKRIEETVTCNKVVDRKSATKAFNVLKRECKYYKEGINACNYGDRDLDLCALDECPLFIEEE